MVAALIVVSVLLRPCCVIPCRNTVSPGIPSGAYAAIAVSIAVVGIIIVAVIVYFVMRKK